MDIPSNPRILQGRLIVALCAFRLLAALQV